MIFEAHTGCKKSRAVSHANAILNTKKSLELITLKTCTYVDVMLFHLFIPARSWADGLNDGDQIIKKTWESTDSNSHNRNRDWSGHCIFLYGAGHTTRDTRTGGGYSAVYCFNLFTTGLHLERRPATFALDDTTTFFYSEVYEGGLENVLICLLQDTVGKKIGFCRPVRIRDYDF